MILSKISRGGRVDEGKDQEEKENKTKGREKEKKADKKELEKHQQS